jgi:hypothetical protein
MRNQLHCISLEIFSMFNTSYFDVQPSTGGLTSYLLISMTDPLFKTPLGLQKHSIAIVRDRLQQFITTMVRFRVRVWRRRCGDKDDGCEYKCRQAMKSLNQLGNRQKDNLKIKCILRCVTEKLILEFLSEFLKGQGLVEGLGIDKIILRGV